MPCLVVGHPRAVEVGVQAAGSQLDGPAPSTRALIERSAALGMLSCKPAQAA